MMFGGFMVCYISIDVMLCRYMCSCVFGFERTTATATTTNNHNNNNVLETRTNKNKIKTNNHVLETRTISDETINLLIYLLFYLSVY